MISKALALLFNDRCNGGSEQDARSLELRQAASLSQLWFQQGRRAEAQHALSEVYKSFTEGLESVDLRTAKT